MREERESRVEEDEQTHHFRLNRSAPRRGDALGGRAKPLRLLLAYCYSQTGVLVPTRGLENLKIIDIVSWVGTVGCRAAIVVPCEAQCSWWMDKIVPAIGEFPSNELAPFRLLSRRP